ncbi:YhdP family protein [uncultured Ramlibacter sp.]|uniref:YhdP family protein n=1 Tax=uncultured Ramlibacter sp. TaxID=260755 RepID=UPI0026145A5F|nr:YhdP family protein [uncultured Ramlibacter sp.]
MNESPPPPSSLLKTCAALAKWLLWLLVACWLVLALAWGALHGWIVPRIGELRPDLEIEASRVLGVPVRIGSVTARSEGPIPSFELRDVVLLDPQGREALRLARVVAALTPRSLWNLGFAQLYIEKPELDVRRSRDGKIFIAGLALSSGSSGDDGRAADWFFRQTEVVVRGGTLRWTDESRAAPPLALADLDFTMRNSTRRHALRLDATPPAQWGERFSLRALFRQPLLSTHHGRWREWDGQLHADFARIDVSQLRRYADLGVNVASGRGALRAWADVSKGEVTGGVADMVLADVNATLGAGLAPLALDNLSGRLGGKRLAGGFDFETRDLQFRSHEGQRWPGGNVAVTWTEAQGQQAARGQLRADRLDLAALSQVASRLPLGSTTHAALAAHAPAGLVETVQAKWQGPLAAPLRYEARGRVSRLEIASRPGLAHGDKPAAGVPGIRGAALDFDFSDSGGKAKLALQDGALDFPGVFEEPVLPFQQLAANLQWQRKGEQLEVSVSGLKFSNADTQGEGQVSWRTGDAGARFPGVLDLQASLSRADGARVWRYLPLGVHKPARDYVQASVQQGSVTEARFRVKGRLHDFPFANGQPGEFKVTAKVQNVLFAYVPPHGAAGTPQWPALSQLAGELVFERGGMQVKGATGRFAGSAGLQVKADAQIPQFHGAVVNVNGNVRGPLAESLAFVNASPLAAMTSRALAKTSASGNAEVVLKLALPLATLERSRVQGSVTLAGNDMQLSPDSPMLSRARGVVGFSEQGFSLAGTQARALGGDVRIEGGGRSVPAGSTEPSVQVRVQGAFTAEGLRQATELGSLARLGSSTSGGAAYNATLAVRRGVMEVMVNSTLQGLALNLPPPLAKPADAALPLRYENALVRESLAGSAARLQDQVALDLGRVASLAYIRDVSGAEPRVLRGGIAVGLAPGESAPLPEQGVQANVNLAKVDIDAWEAALAGVGVDVAQGRSAVPRASLPTSQSYLPTVMALRASELTVEGRTLHNVVVGGSREGLVWRANVDARELNGYVEYQQSAGAGNGRVYARLARLAIAASTASEVETLLDQQPESIPALDIVVDDFELKGRKFGRLDINAVNRGAGAVAREGGVREWRLNKLGLTMPEGSFTATGNWAALEPQAGPVRGTRAAAERRRTVMNFKLDIADSGQLLARFGMKDIVRRGKGRMEGQIAWTGSPLGLDYPSLTGAFNVNVEAGQFLKADPGIAKLLGVLSLQSLPRRLTLDFRDVFSQGFAFDFLRGDITIQQGVAATNNLQMKGVNAAVLMEGRADIAKETQDISVVVVPEIDAGTAALVAGAINPLIGIGTFVAQMVLKRPLIAAATQQFHIDGTWADPRITKVDRKAALPAAAEAPPSGKVQGSN